MTQITLDAELAGRLGDMLQTVDLYDPDGRLLGRFVPIAEPSQWEPVGPDVSEEDLDRREQADEQRSSTADVLARLESL
jgi:hypothetical protein